MSAAAGQHDLLRLSPLRAERLRSSVVRRLVGEGVLHDVHRGVFKVGTPRLSPDGRRLAAVYAAGSGSALSHRDAAELRRLALRGRRDTVDVTAKRGCRDQPGITLHRVRRLDSADVSTVRGIPVTSVARTFVDLADVLSTAELRRVIHEAEVEGLFDLVAVDDAMRRANGRDLRKIAAAVDGHRPRSKRDIEQQLAQIAWRAGLRGARRNMRTLADSEEFELDVYYPDFCCASKPMDTASTRLARSSTPTDAVTASSSSSSGSPPCATRGRTSPRASGRARPSSRRTPNGSAGCGDRGGTRGRAVRATALTTPPGVVREDAQYGRRR